MLFLANKGFKANAVKVCVGPQPVLLIKIYSALASSLRYEFLNGMFSKVLNDKKNICKSLEMLWHIREPAYLMSFKL